MNKIVKYKLFKVSTTVAIVLLLSWGVSSVADDDIKSATNNFSAMGLVSEISEDSLEISEAKGSDKSGKTSYDLNIDNLEKIQTNKNETLNLVDIKEGDKVIVQGLTNGSTFFIKRIISFTSVSTATSTDEMFATSTATTTDDLIASSTTSTSTEDTATSTEGSNSVPETASSTITSTSTDIATTSTTEVVTEVSTTTASTTEITVPTIIDNVIDTVVETITGVIENIVDLLTGNTSTTTPPSTVEGIVPIENNIPDTLIQESVENTENVSS